jgi:hypothetical protein
MRNGLNENPARKNASNAKYKEPGSFFTFELGPPNAVGPGFNLAYIMGRNKCLQPVVLILILPSPVVSDLLNKKLVRISRIPAVEIPEVVFSPKAYPVINKYATWQIADPHNRPPLP